MHISRDALLKITKDTVAKRFAHDPNVTAVFLVGSLRPESAAIENIADVDLLVLHNGEIPRDREIIKLSNEYHLDISYEVITAYSQPHELRGDGLRGWAMWDPQLLFQRGRFFEYTQSIVRAQFEEPVNIIKRALSFSVPAREAWFEMQSNPEDAHPLQILSAAQNAVNALACLSGPPLPERRVLAGIQERARAINVEELVQTIFTCVARNASPDTIRQWIPAWESAFKAASLSPADLRLHAVRLAYYKNAIETQLNSDLPRAALWPMLFTWALASENGTFTDEHSQAWNAVCSEIGLNSSARYERLQALDTYLDNLEDIFEQLETDNGLSQSY